MEKIFKTLSTLVFALLSTWNIYAEEANDTTYNIPIKRTNKGNGHNSDEHPPRKSPAKESMLSEIIFNPADKSISFSSIDNIHFSYKVYNSMESVICEGEVSIAKDGTERIFLPECAAGDYVIIIDLNGLLYRGDFKIEDVF